MDKKVCSHTSMGLFLLLLVVALLGTGCGVMFHGSKQQVEFTILPREAAQDAVIFVEDREIPGTSVELPRKQAHKYRVECPGYEVIRGEILNKPDAVALILDIAGTWGIGLLIDLAAGAAHNLEPDPVKINLRPLEPGSSY
ncbi:MAG: hypothetical protein ABIK28_02220, partial [Planctomycetota bacterium]